MPDTEIATQQTCRCCQQDQPADEFRKRDGGVCATCMRLKRNAIKKHKEEICKEADGIVIFAMKKVAERVDDDEAYGFSGVPNVGTVTEDIVSAFGGSRGLAVQYAANYLTAEPGSVARQRILADINRSVQKASELGYAKKPLELLSDEELEELLQESFRRNGITVLDADQKEPES